MYSRRIQILLGICFATFAFWPAAVRAVIVFEKGSNEPLRGYLVDADEIRVIFNEIMPGGETRERILPRGSIDDLIYAVVPERLAELRPEQAEAYRDYAEELAEKREDPDAQQTAIRLYLIAAYLKPDELGRSCLLGMTVLARSVEEERRFWAMAYLLDPKHDPSLLRAPASVAANLDGLTESQRNVLRNLLRMIRLRRNREAHKMLERPSVQEALDRVGSWIRRDELQPATQADSTLSAALLRSMVTLELLLSGASPPSDAGGTDVSPWSRIIARGSTARVFPLELETLTEFDPREQKYLDGRWIDPEAESRDSGSADE